MDHATLRCRWGKKEKVCYVKLFCNSFLVIKTLESSVVRERESCSLSNYLSISFWITQFRYQSQKLWSVHRGFLITPNLMNQKNSDLIFEIAFWGPFFIMKTLESRLICEIQSCSSSNHLFRYFWITQFRYQIQKLWSKH